MAVVMGRGLVPGEFLDVLRHEGLLVKASPGWQTHNTNSRGEWGPVRGVMLGSTGSGDTARSVSLVRHAVGGPTANAVIAGNGVVWMIASGRTQHTGQGSPTVLRDVIAGRTGSVPAMNTIDGNRYFYGVKLAHSGESDSWPDAQLGALVAFCTALCRAHGWTYGYPPVLGQAEWSTGGSPLTGIVMQEIRYQVGLRLRDTA